MVFFEYIVLSLLALSLKAISAISLLVGYCRWLRMDIKWDRKDCRTLLCSTVCISYIVVVVIASMVTKSLVWKNVNSTYLVIMAYFSQAICLAITGKTLIRITSKPLTQVWGTFSVLQQARSAWSCHGGGSDWTEAAVCTIHLPRTEVIHIAFMTIFTLWYCSIHH